MTLPLVRRLGVAILILTATCTYAQASILTGDVTQDATGYHLSWATSSPQQPVDVLVGGRPDDAPAAMRLAASGVRDGHATISVAKGMSGGTGRTYFLLREHNEEGGLRLAVRHLELEGVANFRDLGGYPTADGKHVKWGQIFRSSELSGLTDADMKVLDGLGLKLIYDLRGETERKFQPTAWHGAGTEVVTSDKQDIAGQGPLFTGTPTPETIRKAMNDAYRTLYKSYEPEYKVMFARALGGAVPILVHCTGGRDRTGIAAALVLTALGVPRSTIIEDYVLTGRYITPEFLQKTITKNPAAAAGFSKLSPALLTAMIQINPADIELVFTSIEAEYGSVERYLADVYGITPDKRVALRQMLTE